MDKIVRYFLISVLLYSVSSCIKDDPVECPSAYTVQVLIKDKNYTNLELVPQEKPMDESMPFSSFAKNIYYSLRNMASGQLYMESGVMPVMGDGQSYTINFDKVPYGTYELVVWGNLEPNISAGVLHNNETESTDLYLGSTTLTFSAGQEEGILMLERAKGKLLVLCNNFPSTITSINQNMSNVYQNVNPKREYSGNTTVKKTFLPSTILETVLAPSVNEVSSKLNLEFLDSETEDVTSLIIPEIDISIKRNEVTLVSVDYNDINKDWEIWTYIDGKWTLVHHLSINDL